MDFLGEDDDARQEGILAAKESVARTMRDVEAYIIEDIDHQDIEYEYETYHDHIEDLYDHKLGEEIIQDDKGESQLSMGFVSSSVLPIEEQQKPEPDAPERSFEGVPDEGDCIQYSGVIAVAEKTVENLLMLVEETKVESLTPSSTSSSSSSSSSTSSPAVEGSAATFPDDGKEKFPGWPTIKQFTEELGTEKIKMYLSTWYFEEDWLYTVHLVHAQSDVCSDYYIYETLWSIPTKEYPVPQVTASILFTIVVSRIKPKNCEVEVYYVLEGGSYRYNPRVHLFQESWLFNILDAKLLLFKALKF